MRIENIRVNNLEESIVASGLPMQVDFSPELFDEKVKALREAFANGTYEDNKDFIRARKLAHNAPGTGHNNFLSGILVSYNVTATQVWWMQMERYHFNQIVSSQSKMHRLRLMNGDTCFHSKVDSATVVEFDETKDYYTDEEMVYNCPMGLELTARCTTNYLQLKTIYNQRHNHKLKEWRDFCNFILSLDAATHFIATEE